VDWASHCNPRRCSTEGEWRSHARKRGLSRGPGRARDGADREILRFYEALAVVGVLAALTFAAAVPPRGSVDAAAPIPTGTVAPKPTTTNTVIRSPNPTTTPIPRPTSTSTPTPVPTPTPEPDEPALTFLSEPWFAVATYYSWDFAGLPTALEEEYDPATISSACHWSMLEDWLRVTNIDNGCSVVVRCADTGPFRWAGDYWEPLPSWRIDLSEAAFAQIAPLDDGVIVVEVVKVAGEWRGNTDNGYEQSGSACVQQ